MKFDFVIGNPPYQEQAIGDNKGFAPPVYDRFIESAQTISDCVEMIHPARFLFNAGRTPKVWNEKMLNDPHFKILEYYSDASKIFKDTDIMGGVSISYYNRRENYGAIKVFVPNHLLRGLLNKVIKNQDFESISQIMYVQNKFNLDKLYSKNPELKNVIGNDGVDRRIRKNAFEKITVFSENKISRSDIEIFGIVNNKRCSRFIASDYLDKGHENFNKYKVLVPSANGSPSIGSGSQTSVIGYPILLSPLCGYTQSFIGIGAFEHKDVTR